MRLLRTPDSRFDGLPDFPYEPRYVNIAGVRIHYVEEGQGEIVLCLHGEPTWCFVYRKLFRSLASNYRMMALDFAGFGRSDKPDNALAHTLKMHCETVVKCSEVLDLREITLVVHDWGGLIGLAALEAMQHRVARLVIMNTGLPIGKEPIPKDFLHWRNFVERTPDLPVGKIVRSGLARPESMTADVQAAYEAPFPDDTYKAGVRALPLLVPLRPADTIVPEMQRARHFLSSWEKPALALFSDHDPITQDNLSFFRNLIPSARKEPEIRIKNAGHFLQEERGEEVAAEIADFLSRT